MALERNARVAEALAESGCDFVDHGWRWIDYRHIDEAIEREHIRRSVEVITHLTGTRPLGWFSPASIGYFPVRATPSRSNRLGVTLTCDLDRPRIEAAEAAHEVAARHRGGQGRSAGLLDRIRREVELDGKLAAIVSGRAGAASVAERIELIEIARRKGWGAAVVRFVAEVLRERPDLADDEGSGLRYQVAGDRLGTMPLAFFRAVEDTVRQTLGQAVARNQLHREERPALVLADLVNRQDVWVVQQGGRLRGRGWPGRPVAA